MQLMVDAVGVIRCLYGETIPLTALGEVSIRRASRVEPAGGAWFADLGPVGGPKLGPFPLRSLALDAEAAWLDHRLAKTQLS